MVLFYYSSVTTSLICIAADNTDYYYHNYLYISDAKKYVNLLLLSPAKKSNKRYSTLRTHGFYYIISYFPFYNTRER